MPPIKVRLTRFLENKDHRIRLQRTIEMPTPPQTGWVFIGCALMPASITAEIIAWNHTDQLIDCICGTGLMKDGLIDLKKHIMIHYGDMWTVDNPIKLTLDGLPTA